MYENLNIGNEIRYYRMKQKLSQEKLAEKSNLSLNFISKLETGRISNISLNKLLNICKALDIQLGKLVGDDIANTFSELPPSTIELIKMDICQLVWLTKNTSYENVGGIFLRKNTIDS